MTTMWFRRAALALVCAGTALVSACGDGSVVSDLDPERFISVGDGFTDVGQLGYRYTVNDGSLTWNQYLASHYDQTITPASEGGWGYSQGHARVASADTSSGTNAPSVKEQIDTLLARTTFQDNDVMMINGGMSDIVAAVNDTGISDATTATVKAAGTALGEQTRRLVEAGATHVVVTGVYWLGHTPWGRGLDQEDAINDLSDDFNTALLLSIADLGNNVLYFDAAQFFTLAYNNHDNYGMEHQNEAVCTTPDVTTCTTSTLVDGVTDTEDWLFADSLYMAPEILRKFANTSYSENIHTDFQNRW
ncbi:GDSL family lipase [Ottowia sp.]|uniref:GDSL family lipase n=1 Tax=Ottowia sp. TaxID=1898956 RepID=UPI003A83F163